jgi:hypothetical protein
VQYHDQARSRLLEFRQNLALVFPREIARKVELVTNRIGSSSEIVQDLAFRKNNETIAHTTFPRCRAGHRSESRDELGPGGKHALRSIYRDPLVFRVLQRAARECPDDEQKDEAIEMRPEPGSRDQVLFSLKALLGKTRGTREGK